MKKSVKIILINSLLAILTFCCIGLIAIYANVFKKTSYAVSPETDVFEIEYGASVKLSADGLRFKIKMSEDVYNQVVTNDTQDIVKLHGYLTFVEQVDAKTDGLLKDITKKVGGELDETKIYSDKGYYYSNVVLTNIQPNDFENRTFTTFAYINNNGSIRYAEMAKGSDEIPDLDNQSRSLYQIVNLAMLDPNESYKNEILNIYGSWYGDADHPIVISTVEQYDNLVAWSKSNTNKLSGKEIKIKKSVSDVIGSYSAGQKLSEGSVAENCFTVTFYDGSKVLKVQQVVNGGNATAPDVGTKPGYDFNNWSCSFDNITKDTNVYASWGLSRGDVRDIGNLTIYGVYREDGEIISSDNDVIGNGMLLLAGDSGDAIYYPAEGLPQDPNKTVEQSYIAFDGNYGLNDFVAFDFTGKNFPILSFFAENYDKSIFYGDGNKKGVVVATGLTHHTGALFTIEENYNLTMFNASDVVQYGPKMIWRTGKNNDTPSNGVVLKGTENGTYSAFGKANLVDGKHYRAIAGYVQGSDSKSIKLVMALYDLDNDCIVELFTEQTYSFFTGTNGWSTVNDYCKGSIVLYGYLGITTKLDKVYGVYNDTTIGEVMASFGHKNISVNDVAFEGESFTLGTGNLGNPTPGGYNGPNPNDNGYQAYYALDGDYSFDDYVVFDFTGKNMPEVAFFADGYDEYMYNEDTKNKKGVVVASGIMTYNGTGIVPGWGTKVSVSGPYMAAFVGADDNHGGNLMSDITGAMLGRSNLQDDVHYRIMMGFTKGADYRAITLNYRLYSWTDESDITLVEEKSATSWNLFSDTFSMSRDDLAGSIVLYGKFQVFTTKIDKMWGVYENTTMEDIYETLGMGVNTVTFKNYDGTILNTYTSISGDIPYYTGTIPTKPADGLCSSYEFAGWDKPFAPLTQDIEYTAVFNGTLRENITINNTTVDGKIVLGSGSIGEGANYITGNITQGYVHQAYFGIDGNYGLNDYIAFEFTGKNMPEIAFFAKNYDDSMYKTNDNKRGVVVVSGLTNWQGVTLPIDNYSQTYDVNIDGALMVQNANARDFVDSGNSASATSSALRRSKLVDGKHYRIIMGIIAHGKSAIKLEWSLYDMDNMTVVEDGNLITWNFFTGSNATVANMKLTDLLGSIVFYGRFGITCTIDKLYGVFEDTTLANVKSAFSSDTYTVKFNNYDGTELASYTLPVGTMPDYDGNTPIRYSDGICSSYEFIGWDKEIAPAYGNAVYTAVFNGTLRNINIKNGEDNNSNNPKTTVTADGKIILNQGNIGDNANYLNGNSQKGFVHQAYFGLDGNYGINDYIAFEFTGKNMPEIAFFAKNYDDSMYKTNSDKRGIVVVSGLTDYQGNVYGSQANAVNIDGALMVQDANSGSFVRTRTGDALKRANLVDGKHYRIIMGFDGNNLVQNTDVKLVWSLFDIDNGTVVEDGLLESWGFFDGSNATVANMKLTDLIGSIVLYGKFGTPCTIDKLYAVFEDTTLANVKSAFSSDTYTVKFNNYDGTELASYTLPVGVTPEYKGATPERKGGILPNYVFNGWDKKIGPVMCNVTYTAQFVAEGVTSNNTTINDSNIVLGSSSIGDSAHYSGSNNTQNPPIIGTVHQSYLAFDGNYGLNDYIVFDFTGKNMPSLSFFANNYNDSMYYADGTKDGLVVLTGLTLYNGNLYIEHNDAKDIFGGKGLEICGPHMLHNTMNSGLNGVLGFANKSKNNNNLSLGRANLVDGKKYRIIIGFEPGDDPSNKAIKLVYTLYSVTDGAIVEEFWANTYNFFTGTGGWETVSDFCSGSIVLYGHFGTTTTIDKVWGVFEESDMATLKERFAINGGQGSSDPTSNAPDYSNSNGNLEFFGYSAYSDGTFTIDGVDYYIGKSLATLKQFSLYNDVGMTIYKLESNFQVDNDPQSIVKVKKLIDDLKKVGITKTIVYDSRIVSTSLQLGSINQYFASDELLDAYIYNCIKDYAGYEGVYGVILGDEPKYAALSCYSAVYKSIKRVCASNGWNLFIMYNLNPLNYTKDVYQNYYPASSGTYDWDHKIYDENADNYSWYQKLKDKTIGTRNRYDDCVIRYTQYINDFLTAMQPDCIMYDDYPLHEDKNNNDSVLNTFIPNLQIVASLAKQHNAKLYVVTQTHENNATNKEHKRDVTENGARWLNNILLGFGAKGIGYYTYYTRSETDASGGESYIDGQSFVDYYGNTTPLYDFMKDIIADDKVFEKTITQFNYQGSRYYKGSTASANNNQVSKITVANSFTALSSFTVDKEYALVTELYDSAKGNYMYMAMNIVDPDVTGNYNEKMVLTFNNYTNALVFSNGEFSEVALSNHTLTLNNIAPGEAVYVIPFN